MAVLKCKMCGGQLTVPENANFIECEYCGSVQTLPNLDSEKKTNLFNRANTLRMKKEFDKAAGVYESLVAEFPEEAEAYWGLCLCKFGIEYVDDKKTGRKIPTCHRTCKTSILNDSDFRFACTYADGKNKNLYQTEARTIDEIQKKILEIASKESPYDIFISYKETDDSTGLRTADSADAQDLYTSLVEKGYRVFFSRVTLRSQAAGENYEPYIFAALNSAKVMILLGSKAEYLNSEWVKNEWSRYLAITENEPSKKLLVCFRNMDAYDLPEEVSGLQALDMGSITFHADLMQNIEKVIPRNDDPSLTNTIYSSQVSGAVENLLKRAEFALQEKQYKEAEDFASRALDNQPENWKGYHISFLAKQSVPDFGSLDYLTDYRDDPDFHRMVQFAPAEMQTQLAEISELCRIAKIYFQGVILYQNEKNYREALARLLSIKDDYGKIEKLGERFQYYQYCVKECETEIQKDENYKNALNELKERTSGNFIMQETEIPESVSQEFEKLKKNKEKYLYSGERLGMFTWLSLLISVIVHGIMILILIIGGTNAYFAYAIGAGLCYISVFTVGFFIEAYFFQRLFGFDFSIVRGILILLGGGTVLTLLEWLIVPVIALFVAGIVGLVINRIVSYKESKSDSCQSNYRWFLQQTVSQMFGAMLIQMRDTYAPILGEELTSQILTERLNSEEVQGLGLCGKDLLFYIKNEKK